MRAWSAALNRDDNERAASLFAPDAVIVQGGRLYVLRTRAVAVAWNAALPCSGRIVSLAVRTAIEVEDGRIVYWRELDGAPQPTLGGAV